MKASESQLKANKKYDEKNTRQINLKLNMKTDAEIIARLDMVANKQGFIKELIEKEINESSYRKQLVKKAVEKSKNKL